MVNNGENNHLTTVANRLNALSEDELSEKYNKIEHKLFEFANFMEAQLAFLYTPVSNEIPTEGIIKKALQIEKGLALLFFTDAKNAIHLYKISNYNKDLVLSENDILEPDPERCKKITLDEVDIAIIPGLALWSFALLIVTLAAAAVNIDARVVWNKVEYRR